MTGMNKGRVASISSLLNHSLRSYIAVQLAEHGISVFLGPISQMLDKILNLLPSCFAQGFCAAEVGGVSLHQGGIQPVLADDLAQAVADLGAAAVPICWLGGEFLWLPRGLLGFGKGSDLLDRADADTVRLAQSSVHGPGLSHAHLGTVDEGRHVRRISIAITGKASAGARSINDCLESPAPGCRIAKLPNRQDPNTCTVFPAR